MTKKIYAVENGEILSVRVEEDYTSSARQNYEDQKEDPGRGYGNMRRIGHVPFSVIKANPGCENWTRDEWIKFLEKNPQFKTVRNIRPVRSS